MSERKRLTCSYYAQSVAQYKQVHYLTVHMVHVNKRFCSLATLQLPGGGGADTPWIGRVLQDIFSDQKQEIQQLEINKSKMFVSIGNRFLFVTKLLFSSIGI